MYIHLRCIKMSGLEHERRPTHTTHRPTKMQSVIDNPSMTDKRKVSDVTATVGKKISKKKSKKTRQMAIPAGDGAGGADVVDVSHASDGPALSAMTEVPELPRKDATFAITFNQPRGLCSVIETISSVLKDATFQIVPMGKDRPAAGRSRIDEQFSGMALTTIDSRHSCIVIAKLQGSVVVSTRVEVNGDDLCFCVNVSMFLTHLKSIGADKRITMYGIRGSSKLYMLVQSPINAGHSRVMALSTLNKDADTEFDVSDIDYVHLVEMDLFQLRNIIKLAKGISSDHIRIRILERPPTVGGIHVTYLLIHIYGENSYDEHCFCSSTEVQAEGKTKSMVIKNSDMVTEEAEPCRIRKSDLTETFNHVFAVDYLHCFLKSLDRHTITLRFSPTKPMIMTSSLGDEHSFVSFLLAPRENDDDLPDVVRSFD